MLRDAPEDIDSPVPYLGEVVLFDDSVDELDDDMEIWLAIVESNQYLWRPQDGGEPGAGESWEPDRVVLARKDLRLVTYDWDSSKETKRDVKAAGDGFTMSELLREANRTFVELSNAGCGRIFEGLRRGEPGVYRISTGS